MAKTDKELEQEKNARMVKIIDKLIEDVQHQRELVLKLRDKVDAMQKAAAAIGKGQVYTKRRTGFNPETGEVK